MCTHHSKTISTPLVLIISAVEELKSEVFYSLVSLLHSIDHSITEALYYSVCHSKGTVCTVYATLKALYTFQTISVTVRRSCDPVRSMFSPVQTRTE